MKMRAGFVSNSSTTSFVIVGKKMKMSQIEALARSLGFFKSKDYNKFIEDMVADGTIAAEDVASQSNEALREGDDFDMYSYLETMAEFLRKKLGYKGYLDAHFDENNDEGYLGSRHGVDYNETFDIDKLVSEREKLATYFNWKLKDVKLHVLYADMR